MHFLIFTPFCRSHCHITQSDQPHHNTDCCQHKTPLCPGIQFIKLPLCHSQIILLWKFHIHRYDQTEVAFLQFVILCHVLIIVIFHSANVCLKAERFVVITQIPSVFYRLIIGIFLRFGFFHICHICIIPEITQPVIYIGIILVIFVVVNFVIRNFFR